MIAYNLYAVGDLRRDEVAGPALAPGWALVRVKASGICSSDIPRIFKKGTYHFPTIPGHEFAGTVERVNDEAQRGLVGRRVGVFPLIPCRRCPQCARGRYEMCEHYDYIGSRRDGAFAELVAVPVWNLIELPENVSFRTAAMLEPLSVALHAVNRLGVRAGDRVAVVGTGMIGFAAAQWARAKGAGAVDVIGRSEAKKAIADRLPGVGYRFGASALDGQYDRVLEAVGESASVESAVRLTAPGGTLALMGNPAGDIRLAQDVYWRILRQQLTVTGTWNSSYERGAPCDWTEARDMLAAGRIDADGLVTHVFGRDELPRGLELMRRHEEVYCKVMVEWP